MRKNGDAIIDLTKHRKGDENVAVVSPNSSICFIMVITFGDSKRKYFFKLYASAAMITCLLA